MRTFDSILWLFDIKWLINASTRKYLGPFNAALSKKFPILSYKSKSVYRSSGRFDIEKLLETKYCKSVTLYN
ncbi:hypothetical protein GCM10007938_21470 [Vibrio zhanjiangensis]|uniref:Uncharacterized protein n=1 Tax=Vibrio zhanjiangensis TaxID=1046128 RepID=A0ABQ6EZC5_9VIBR|nr:hypothetical protein GCM10007938_21470 [Vibrio zhanjiangensis]